MKTLLTPLFLVAVQLLIAQQAYYNDVNLTLTGQDLYFELQDKIDINNTNFTYGDVRDTVKITDEDEDNTSNVLLIYGYDDGGNCQTDRTRNKDLFGGMSCEYNREHVFARSRANPEMGSTSNSSTGIVADPHNLRPSDVSMNGAKGNRKFTSGNGDATEIGSDLWYPGDEWKGDVARMMMYMYTRYGDRCLPSLIGQGGTQGTTDMLQLFINWNVEDPVSEIEDQRNPYLETQYGNRNPFIDNPYLATIIWGGPAAEDRWNLFSVEDISQLDIQLFPVPASDVLFIRNASEVILTEAVLYDLSGRIVIEQEINNTETRLITSKLNSGIYILELISSEGKLTKKLLIE